MVAPGNNSNTTASGLNLNVPFTSEHFIVPTSGLHTLRMRQGNLYLDPVHGFNPSEPDTKQNCPPHSQAHNQHPQIGDLPAHLSFQPPLAHNQPPAFNSSFYDMSMSDPYSRYAGSHEQTFFTSAEHSVNQGASPRATFNLSARANQLKEQLKGHKGWACGDFNISPSGEPIHIWGNSINVPRENSGKPSDAAATTRPGDDKVRERVGKVVKNRKSRQARDHDGSIDEEILGMESNRAKKHSEKYQAYVQSDNEECENRAGMDPEKYRRIYKEPKHELSNDEADNDGGSSGHGDPTLTCRLCHFEAVDVSAYEYVSVFHCIQVTI